jgi:hypothetical protein
MTIAADAGRSTTVRSLGAGGGTTLLPVDAGDAGWVTALAWICPVWPRSSKSSAKPKAILKGSPCQEGNMCLAPLSEGPRAQRGHTAPERGQTSFELCAVSPPPFAK